MPVQELEARVDTLEQRLAEAEARIAQLTGSRSAAVPAATTLMVPVRLTDPKGTVLLELGGDQDGGYLHLNDADGRMRVTFGTNGDGGWLDLINAGNQLSITLVAREEGGEIEITRPGQIRCLGSDQSYPSPTPENRTG